MSREHPKKPQAKKLFVENGYTGKEIHDLLGISEKGISKWRTDENWDEERAMYATTPEAIIQYLFSEINLIKDSAKDEEGKRRALNTKEINALSVISTSIQKVRGNISPQIVMQVLNGLIIYLQHKDLELAKRLTDYIAEYYNNYKSEKV
jgi:uncharacterized protein YjcR